MDGASIPHLPPLGPSPSHPAGPLSVRPPVAADGSTQQGEDRQVNMAAMLLWAVAAAGSLTVYPPVQGEVRPATPADGCGFSSSVLMPVFH